MQNNNSKSLRQKNPSMSEHNFRRFSSLIYEECGVNISSAKKTMLTSRLMKRLRLHDTTSFSEYYDYVTSRQGRSKELVHMINVVTTNKTDFFREPKHLDFLLKNCLPDLYQYKQMNPLKRLNIWSAGCSSGEEPYTLAMVLKEFFSKQQIGDFSILATDISTRVLETAKQGIYLEKIVKPVPLILKHKYLMRGKDSQKGLFRIIPELRNRVRFERLNLIENNDFRIKTIMDIIFCRNVIIYFDRQTQIKLFKKFYNQLIPGGYLFIGHSETLKGINDQFLNVAISVYRKPI